MSKRPKLVTAAANLPDYDRELLIPKDMQLDLANPEARKPELDLLVSVACPTCGAEVGQRCIAQPSEQPRNRNSPHAARLDIINQRVDRARRSDHR